ncbi:hypothetical protein EVAR_4899_1 [Eumeta japonica]|uniref:Uncharacterized protein n=1 Tax=Eumeta variegata TaxID=151549 RepID=A0A4C1XYJ7_EUMVA|nr:hypothetical protein EVAR_4899_1 [Eumeta japonica]
MPAGLVRTRVCRRNDRLYVTNVISTSVIDGLTCVASQRHGVGALIWLKLKTRLLVCECVGIEAEYGPPLSLLLFRFDFLSLRPWWRQDGSRPKIFV